MTSIRGDSGSFRDPSGRIYYVGDRVLRTVTEYAAEDFDFVRASGLIERLVADGHLIDTKIVDANVLGDEAATARYVIEHPKIPFISYPYEWPFSALRAAALHHLDIQLESLEAGISLSDASAYNVQFLGARPIFIDTLSLRKYEDGEMWGGYRQFCEQFLNPLLLRTKLGVAHNAWYRGALDGIETMDLRRLLSWKSKFSKNILLHVIAHSTFQKTSPGNRESKKTLATAYLPTASYRRMLQKLRHWIENMVPADVHKTVWKDYENTHSYADDEYVLKKDFIAKFARSVQPNMILDLGCNTGEFSDVALKNGAGYSVGFDFDQGALEGAFSRAATQELNFLPLFLDGTNPSPDQGWNQAERKGLSGRANADGLIALAFVHHLAIGKNVPLSNIADWLVSLAPQGVVEFVPKNDPKVEELLALRKDIFPDYEESHFVDCLSRRAEIVESKTITKSGRRLFWYRRR